ncbi:MAG: helix-turn-helix domain-containing protein [Bacteroidaceae bacterium]|nr:helix-turn-helix domain-containing protein [Bacteroidaceae bacterium]
MTGLSQSTFMLVDEAALRKVVTDTVRQVMNQAKAEAEAAKEMATLTREEVAELLNVTKPTLWRWEKAGYLIPKKIGKRVLYLRSEVEEMVRKGGAA